jgi:hypothetical protein
MAGILHRRGNASREFKVALIVSSGISYKIAQVFQNLTMITLLTDGTYIIILRRAVKYRINLALYLRA